MGTSTITEVSIDRDLKPTVVKQYIQTAGSATMDSDIATINGKE